MVHDKTLLLICMSKNWKTILVVLSLPILREKYLLHKWQNTDVQRVVKNSLLL